jgi:hypothetical protein
MHGRVTDHYRGFRPLRVLDECMEPSEPVSVWQAAETGPDLNDGGGYCRWWPARPDVPTALHKLLRRAGHRGPDSYT